MGDGVAMDTITRLLSSERGPMRHSFRVGLRAARAEVQADAEGFETIVFEIERLGRNLAPTGTGLGAYAGPLETLVKRALGEEEANHFRQRLFLLKESRNDNAHQGAHARHASLEAVDAALVLEDALAQSWKNLEARNVMVANPIVAEHWHTLHEIRHQMLRYAFTSIPVDHAGQWFLIRDGWLARWVAGKSNTARKAAYRQTVAEIISELGEPVTTIPSSAKLGEIDLSLLQKGLLLVHDELRADKPVVGVIAASDML